MEPESKALPIGGKGSYARKELRTKEGTVKKLLLLLSLCFLFTAPVYSSDRTGTTGAQFLKIGVGARAVGMGEAFCGVADDINALYWNPAGLSDIGDRQATAMYISWFQSMNYAYLAYGQPIRHWGVFAGGITYLSSGDIPKTTVDSGGDYVDEGTNFSAYDLAFTIGYGRKIKEDISLGGAIKIISEKIESENASAFALDIGGIYKGLKLRDRVLPLALVIQNLGTEVKFGSEGDSLPINIKAGASYGLEFSRVNSSLTLALDLNYPLDNAFNANFGSELWYKGTVAVRLGYKTATVKDINALSGLSIGGGFRYQKYGIDYAWVPYGDLGNTHRISLVAKF